MSDDRVVPGDVSGSPRHGLVYAALLAILIIAAALRFYDLRSAGIFSVDEGRYLLDGLSVFNIGERIFAAGEAKWTESRGGPEFSRREFVIETDAALREVTPFLPKVLFSHFVALMIAVFGFNTWNGNVVEAFFGTLCVPALFLIVKRLSSPQAGLIAAGLLAVSAFHVHFSRNTYPQCTPLFFYLVAVYFHLIAIERVARGRAGRYWIASGFAAGLAFAANFQTAGVFPAFAALHVLASLSPAGWSRKLRSLTMGSMYLVLGFGACSLLFEFESYPLLLLFRAEGLEWPHKTYFELLAPRLTSHATAGYEPSAMIIYPYFLWRFEFLAPMLLLGASAVYCVLHRGPGKDGGTRSKFLAGIYLATLFVGPWLVYSTLTLQAARTFIFCHPFFLATAGCVAAAAWGRGSIAAGNARSIWGMVLAVAVLACETPALLEVLRTKSSTPDVIAYLKSRPDPAGYASFSSVLDCYLREAGIPGGGYYFTQDHAAHADAFLITDLQELYDGRYPDESPAAQPYLPPVAEFQHRCGRLLIEVESLPGRGNAVDGIRYLRQLDLDRARRILVCAIKPVATENESSPPAPALPESPVPAVVPED